jgi:hypothetical protein
MASKYFHLCQLTASIIEQHDRHAVYLLCSRKNLDTTMQSLSDSQSHTALLDRYAQWPYYLPPDDWLVNSDTSSLHWTNFSPPDDWLADHEELFSQQTGQPGSEMVDRLVEKDPISSLAVDPFPLSQMLGPRSSSGSGRSNNHSAFHSPHDGISGPFPPPSPCFAQVPSTGRRDLVFLLYRYGQYATGALFVDCVMKIGTHVTINFRI